jgi:glycosyltransferase involved in cell wall biosynthesis
MKSVLFVMLEIDSASGTCTLNVAKEMARKNWHVDCLTYTTTRRFPDGVGSFHIKPKLFSTLPKCVARNRIMSFFYRNLYRIKVALMTPFWPLNSPLFSYRLYKKINRIYKEKKYDYVIPVYTQIDPVLACYFIKQNNKNVKVIPYFLDSLSGGPCPKFLLEEAKIKKGIAWEKYLLKDMDAVIYMESSRKHHEKYSKSFEYYKNVYYLDIPMLVDFQKGMPEKENSLENVVNLIYIGSLPRRIRNPEYAFQLLSEVDGVTIHIVVVGAEEDVWTEKNGCDITWVGKVSHEKALEYMYKADILLNIGNRVKGMVPSKIFEYMSTGKPIISFAPIEDEPSTVYLSKYNAACVISERDGYLDNLNKIKKFIKNTPKNKMTECELLNLFYKNTPGAFADFLCEKSAME